jgi:hypothetical protein
MIVTEQLKGNLGNYRLRWLVSCKHFAKSGRSVAETDEPNIIERVRSFKCDGFIGFYSTIPSSGLNTRLMQLKGNNDIKDYRIFDDKLIENYLITIGYSNLLLRYFPLSYKSIKPLHAIFKNYISLECPHCNKDLLKALYNSQYNGNIIFIGRHELVKDKDGNEDWIQHIDDFIWICKDCNSTHPYKNDLGWEDIGDIAIPAFYVKWVLTIMNRLESGIDKYEPNAYKKLKNFVMAISQKVLREMTEEEHKRFLDLIELELLGV